MKNKVIGFLSLAASAASILAACSSSSSGGGSAADACTTFANAYISYYSKCSGEIDPAKTSDFSARYATLCKSELTLKGIPDLSGSFNACASALNGASCSTSFESIDACQFENAVGSLANGTACTDNLQCSSGSCVTNASTGDAGTDTTCGTCTAAIADGGDCSTGACVQGDECQFSFADDGTSTYTCVAKKAPGDVGASCEESSECKSPNHCAFDDSGTGSSTGTCTAPVASGGACEESQDCAAGLVCLASAGPGGSGGETCATALKEGATCSGAGCDVGLGCDSTTNKCVKFTFAAAGQPCDGQTILCSDGSCNVPTDGTGSGATAGTCPTIIPDGQACSTTDDTSQCDLFADCTNGKCTLGVTICN